MFSHVKQEELHNKSSVVQSSLLVMGYSGPSSVSVGGLCVTACIYVAEFNRVGLQRKSVLNRVVLEMLLTHWRPQCEGIFFFVSFSSHDASLCLSHILQPPRHTATVCEGSFSEHSGPNLSGCSSMTILLEGKCYLDTFTLLLELPTFTVSPLS